MGKAGRFACIFTPMALTAAAFICLLFVFSGQTNKDLSLSRDLYFFKANTKNFSPNPGKDIPDIPGTTADDKLIAALQVADQNRKLKDFYLVGLRNYCEGDIDDKGKETVTHCSPKQSNFWFNPVEVWQLDTKNAEQIFNDKLQNGLDTYHKAARWMYASFVISICLTAAEFLVGILAIFSRWGSLATTIVSTAQTLFIISAAATATAIYSVLAGVFESVLRPVNIRASLGSQMLGVLWLGVAFSVASGFFWLISICCCSGKSPHKKVQVEKAPYTYERVASPYLGARDGAHPMQNMPSPAHGAAGGAYEPFRHNTRV